MRARAPDEGSVKPARWEPSFAVAPPEAPPASGETKTKGGRRKKMGASPTLNITSKSFALIINKKYLKQRAYFHYRHGALIVQKVDSELMKQ